MKILVCVDGSEQSMKAVAKAIEIVVGCQINEITLLSVYGKLPYSITEANQRTLEAEMKKYEQMNAQVKKTHEKHLEHAAMRFREKGVEPDIVLKEGHPAQTITSTANEGNYDMIIMGSRGRGNLKSLLLGSVSHAVMQQTTASVLVVK